MAPFDKLSAAVVCRAICSRLKKHVYPILAAQVRASPRRARAAGNAPSSFKSPAGEAAAHPARLARSRRDQNTIRRMPAL